MVLSFVLLLIVMLKLIDLIGGSCQLRASSMNEGTEISETFQQIQLQLECDKQLCLVSDYYNTSCDTTETALAQILGSNEVHLCEKSCINGDQKEAASVQLETTTKLVTVTSTMVNTIPTNTSYMAPTMVPTTVYMLNTLMCPTPSQSLRTLTSTIIPAVTNCSPSIKTSTIVSTTTEISHKKVFITTTSIVQAPCTPTPNSRESKSCISVTKTIGSRVQQSYVSRLSTQFDQIQAVKACSSSAASSALGALLGIFIVLLALMTAGWIWTCRIVKTRGRMVVNSKQNNFPNTPGTVTINNNTDTLRRVQNPLYEETTINGLLPLSEAELQTGQGDSEETGPTYEIIPLADPVNKKALKKNGNAQLEKEETSTVSGHVSVGYDTTQDNIGSVGGGNVNHHYLPDEKTKGESSQRTGERDGENNYHLLGNAEEEREEVVKENIYHVLENPLDSYDEDYADPDVEETNNIYHVLEGPTPVGEKEREKEIAEREEKERDKVEGEEEREREEPLTEPTAYEIPLASGSKHNSIVLQ